MKNEFVRKAISKDLEKEIEKMHDKIKVSFNIDLNKIQCSKIVAWKSKNSAVKILDKELLQALGGKI